MRSFLITKIHTILGKKNERGIRVINAPYMWGQQQNGAVFIGFDGTCVPSNYWCISDSKQWESSPTKKKKKIIKNK